MGKILEEITPLSPKDCFYIVERYKSEFSYPLHCHEEYELNFIEHGRGVRRVVGDSIEEIGDYELTLVAGKTLAHAWEQGSCSAHDVREITIQFSQQLFPQELLARNQFASIKKMLDKAYLGLNFSTSAIMKVYSLLTSLASMNERFEQYLTFLKIMYELSVDEQARTLASSSFASGVIDAESRRVNKIKEFIAAHYAEDIHLEDMASLVDMAPSALSRFFKQHTGRNLIDFLIDTRLGYASRMLVDTTTGISEICYACGFNNLSNFNRTFKARRGYTPSDFRALYTKNKVLV